MTRSGAAAHPGAWITGFRAQAVIALGLHALLVLGRDGLWGGGDLIAHLRLIQQVSPDAWLHNTYAPAYHWLGAALSPAIGLEAYARGFALAAAALSIAGFRAFQRAAGLPDACASLYALTPFLLSLSWCTPRVEAAGYGLLCFGLAALLRGQRLRLALLLAAAFYVHTAAALLFGLAAGTLALARRDRGAGVALAAGSAGALPLIAAHVGAGCSFPEALLFARGGYARSLQEQLLPPNWPWIVPLAGPVALVCAALGARVLWREYRALAVLCAVLTVAYASNLALAPFGLRSLVTPLRGLSVLAIPVAVAAGVYAAGHRERLTFVVVAASVWAVGASFWAVPNACFVRPIDVETIGTYSVNRCEFVWKSQPKPQ